MPFGVEIESRIDSRSEFKPKAELGKENKTLPPGDVSETLPYLYKGWLLYTSGWDVEWRVDFAKFGDSL